MGEEWVKAFWMLRSYGEGNISQTLHPILRNLGVCESTTSYCRCPLEAAVLKT